MTITAPAPFWSSANVEPKRNYRWKILLSGFGTSNVLWWAKTVTVPAYDVSEVEHNFFDNKYYYPGRVSWSEVTLTLVDPISPDAVQLTNKLLIDSGYNVPASAVGANQKRTISKKNATNAGFKQLSIHVVDSEGRDVEVWELRNPFIKSAKFGDLDYSNDELRTIEMSIRYDWATCVAGTQPATDPQFESTDLNPALPTDLPAAGAAAAPDAEGGG